MNGRKTFGGGGSGGGGGRGRAGATTQQGKEAGQRRPMFRRRKICKFCSDKIDDINYKDIEAADAVCPRARENPAAPYLRHLRVAPA